MRWQSGFRLWTQFRLPLKKWADTYMPLPESATTTNGRASGKQKRRKPAGADQTAGAACPIPKWARVHAESDTANRNVMSWLFDVFARAGDSTTSPVAQISHPMGEGHISLPRAGDNASKPPSSSDVDAAKEQSRNGIAGSVQSETVT